MTAKDALIALSASVVSLVSHVMHVSLLSMLLVQENPKEKMLISVTKLTMSTNSERPMLSRRGAVER